MLLKLQFAEKEKTTPEIVTGFFLMQFHLR